MTAASRRAAEYLWPIQHLGVAIERLGERVGSRATPCAPTSFSAVDVDDEAAMASALSRVLAPFGRDVEPDAIRYESAAWLPAPVIVRVPRTTPATFLVVARRNRASMVVLGLDRQWHTVPTHTISDLLRQPADAEARTAANALLDTVGIRAARRARVADALLEQALAGVDLAQAWRVVPDPGAPPGTLLRLDGIGRRAGLLVLLHAVQFGCWLGAWALLGRGLLDGRVEWGWMTAWGLLLAAAAPLQLWTSWTQGLLAIDAGRLLKGRLLVGALRLEQETLRSSGAGDMLGRVLESDAVESLAISGGLQAVLAVVELAMAAGVLAVGAAHHAMVAGLAGVMVMMAVAAVVYQRRRSAWSASRLHMTNRLVEHIAGHRTRMSQQDPRSWHDAEDRELDDYVDCSRTLDRVMPTLLVLLPRGWLAYALCALAPAFVAGSTPQDLAVALGGALVVNMALRRFAEGLSHLSGAAVSWQETRPIFESATRRAREGETDVRVDPADDRNPCVLEVRDVTVRHASRATPALTGCSLRVADGERLLIRGPSGGGKSTLASVVAGLQEPSSGLVLNRGLDRASLGMDAWRRRIVSAPQYHQNHVFCETLAFNLLMGRAWPPSDRELDDAEVVARDLGLGDLLDRMPSGLMQMVGEGGWQLSHGERSRVFMARALLQGAEVMLLDESFAALDPKTLRDTLRCVLGRAPTLLVIAHP